MNSVKINLRQRLPSTRRSHQTPLWAVCFTKRLCERRKSSLVFSIFSVFGTSGDLRNSPEGKHCPTGPKYWFRELKLHFSLLNSHIVDFKIDFLEKFIFFHFFYIAPTKNTYTKYELLTPTDKKMRSLWRGTRNSLQGVGIQKSLSLIKLMKTDLYDVKYITKCRPNINKKSILPGFCLKIPTRQSLSTITDYLQYENNQKLPGNRENRKN